MIQKNEDNIFITHIYEEILLLEDICRTHTTDEIIDNRILRYCVQKSLEIIGEAANRISDETKNTYPDIAWRDIIGMRNKLTHGYFGIDWNIVCSVLTNDIPALKTQIESIKKEGKN